MNIDTKLPSGEDKMLERQTLEGNVLTARNVDLEKTAKNYHEKETSKAYQGYDAKMKVLKC